MKKTLLLLISAILLLSACGGGKKSLVIGVSQCSNDIWRSKLNEELKLAARANGVEVRFVSADDNSERQMEQIWAFMKEGVDLLVVSPNQTTTITRAVEDAFDAGIPVILFDYVPDNVLRPCSVTMLCSNALWQCSMAMLCGNTLQQCSAARICDRKLCGYPYRL